MMNKNNIKIYVSVLLIVSIMFSCNSEVDVKRTKSGLERETFQTVVDGDSTDLFVLTNALGAEVCITNYGGRIVSLIVPDRDGEFRDVVLGFDRLEEYISKPSSFGATIGRFANRMAYGRFPLDGDTVQLDINSDPHMIHGGAKGWQNQVFDARQLSDSTLVLSYISLDGESGFPGEVVVEVTYTLTHDHALHLAYVAQTNKRTVINMTNHSFFNLSGDPNTTILDHVLYVHADTFTPLDEKLITTGEELSVSNSPFDFRNPITIGLAMQQKAEYAQLQLVQGIDHNFVLNTNGNPEILAAQLYAPSTGIVMDVYTNEPGLQVYTGNMLDGSRVGKGEVVYKKQSAICLESQHFPDSPNKLHWPSTVLEPGETYHSVCVYKFGVRE